MYIKIIHFWCLGEMLKTCQKNVGVLSETINEAQSLIDT